MGNLLFFMKKTAEKEGLGSVLKKIFNSLPCCEMAMCLIISVVLSLLLCLLTSLEGWEAMRIVLEAIWSDLAAVSVSLAGLIMAVLAIVYSLGGNVLNVEEYPKILSELSAVMTFGVFLHLVAMLLALIMSVYDDACLLGLLSLFFFIYSIVMTFNILIHLYCIHSALK